MMVVHSLVLWVLHLYTWVNRLQNIEECKRWKTDVLCGTATEVLGKMERHHALNGMGYPLDFLADEGNPPTLRINLEARDSKNTKTIGKCLVKVSKSAKKVMLERLENTATKQ